MNKNLIIKALEHCTGNSPCKGCPYYPCHNAYELMKDVLTLVKKNDSV